VASPAGDATCLAGVTVNGVTWKLMREGVIAVQNEAV